MRTCVGSLFTKIQKQYNMLKISLFFKDTYKLHGQITPEILGLRMRKFRCIVFIWTQTYREIFKPALVYR